MNKKIFSLLFTFLLVLTASVPSAFSENNKNNNGFFQITSIESQFNSIELSWESSGDYYQLFNDNLLIYNGSDNSFTHTNLDPSSIYSYSIIATDKNGRVVEKTKIKTATRNSIDNTLIQLDTETDTNTNTNSNDILNPLKSNIINTVVTDQAISIMWDEIEGVNEYEVHKNGVYQEKVYESKFIDTKIDPEKEYSYTISGKKRINKEQEELILDHLRNNELKISETEKEALLYEKYTITKNLKPNNNELTTNNHDNSQVKSFASTQWDLRYMTFIKPQYVSNPWSLVSSTKYFGGDNRNWDAYSNKFRTKTDVKVCFCSAGKSVVMNKSIGTTNGYNSSYTLIESDTDSGNGITLTNVDLTGSNKIKFTVNHSSGNPLVTSPTIDYTYTGEFYNNGDYSIVGNHDQAPHHEFYIVQPGYQVLHRAELVSFDHLFPHYPNKYWSASN